jgi:glucose-6-phosphate isomerase
MKHKIYFKLKNKGVEEEAFQAIVEEEDSIGYYGLPEQDISPILTYASSIDEAIEDIAVIGIGGSSLGAKAIYEFIKPSQKLSRRLHFFESTDPLNIQTLLSEIDLKKTHFLVISKSGTTIETFAIYKYLYHLHPHIDSYTFITDANSPLEAYAKEMQANYLLMPPRVGGRFSVLSNVGLLPLALCGIDIASLLQGAKGIKDAFFQGEALQHTILKKAVFYTRHQCKYRVNGIFAYSETLKYFCEWYVQLWGESLGKRQRHSAFNVGLTPIGLIGPKDQHSFLQLIMDGTRNKTLTFIKVEAFPSELTIPHVKLPHLESLDVLNDLPFSTLINMQCDSIIEALLDEDIPLDTITLPQIDEASIGALIYYYELLTSLVGELMDVNTYDQPGVEAGKIILKEKLKKLKEQ